jgi:hypothetical protein
MQNGKYLLGEDYDTTMYPRCQGEHEWAPYIHGVERCLHCLTLRRLPCRCEDCVMTHEEWQAKRRAALNVLTED